MTLPRHGNNFQVVVLYIVYFDYFLSIGLSISPMLNVSIDPILTLSKISNHHMKLTFP